MLDLDRIAVAGVPREQRIADHDVGHGGVRHRVQSGGQEDDAIGGEGAERRQVRPHHAVDRRFDRVFSIAIRVKPRERTTWSVMPTSDGSGRPCDRSLMTLSVTVAVARDTQVVDDHDAVGVAVANLVT